MPISLMEVVEVANRSHSPLPMMFIRDIRYKRMRNFHRRRTYAWEHSRTLKLSFDRYEKQVNQTCRTGQNESKMCHDEKRLLIFL